MSNVKVNMPVVSHFKPLVEYQPGDALMTKTGDVFIRGQVVNPPGAGHQVAGMDWKPGAEDTFVVTLLQSEDCTHTEFIGGLLCRPVNLEITVTFPE